jgi:hypothetical protein
MHNSKNKKQQNTKNKKPSKNNRTKKGGILNIFKKNIYSSPIKNSKTVNTQYGLEKLKQDIENIKLKQFEEIINTNINNLQNLRKKCINNCKSSVCSKNDQETCKEINSMMQEKSEYEWGNFCNSINIVECKDYLRVFKELEFYINYITTLSNNSKKIFEEYKNNIKNEIELQNSINNNISQNNNLEQNINNHYDDENWVAKF